MSRSGKPTLTRHLRSDMFDEAIVPEMTYFVEVWPVPRNDDTRYTEMVSGEDLLACAEWIDQMLQQKDSKDD